MSADSSGGAGLPAATAGALRANYSPAPRLLNWPISGGPEPRGGRFHANRSGRPRRRPHRHGDRLTCRAPDGRRDRSAFRARRGQRAAAASPLRSPAGACPAGGRRWPCASSGRQPRRGPPRYGRGRRRDCFRNPFSQQPLTPPANVYSAARS